MAGGRAAEALRAHGFEGRVVLVGEEAEPPYERPPLSKDYLKGSVPDGKLYLQPPAYYEEQRIEMKLGMRATHLWPETREVELANAERLAYDRLLISTGCQVRRLSVPGSDLDGIHYLRTREDSSRIAAALERAQRVVIVGAGFIGLEAAAAVRALGRDVTVVDRSTVPLERVLGARMGEICSALHRDHGVKFRLLASVREFRGAKRVEEVVLADGSALPCDLAIVGVGVTPAVGWLQGSGIALDNGVLVNEFTETSLSGVYAAGDIANAWNPLFGERLRVEHYDNAQNQGAAAGRAMAGKREPYAPVPYFWSDQYDVTLQYVGHAAGTDQVVLRGEPASRSFVAFYFRGDRLRAAFGIGRMREVMAAKRLIGRPADREALADERADLRKMVTNV